MAITTEKQNLLIKMIIYDVISHTLKNYGIKLIVVVELHLVALCTDCVTKIPS